MNRLQGNGFIFQIFGTFLLLLITTPLVVYSDDKGLSAARVRQHVLMVNERGQHLDPAVEWGLTSAQKDWGYEQNMAAVQSGIQDFCDSFPGNNTTRGPQVVVFVHGGLNSYKTSKKRLERMLSDQNQMLADGFYPLLVVWNSDFFHSYFEHLISVRQGEIRPVLGKITAPVMLAVDLGRGLVRLPLTLGGRWYNDWRTAEMPNSKRGPTAAWEDLEARLEDWQKRKYPDLNGTRLIRAPLAEGSTRKWGERLFRLACYYATQPVKIAVLPLADGLASESWDNMIRRTRTMFQPPETYDFPREYRKAFNLGESEEKRQGRVDDWMARGKMASIETRSKPVPPSNLKPDGTMYEFARRLEFWSTNQVFPESLTWQFVGHSMGTIVLNELFRVAPDVRAERVTYMAAACSIRDFQVSLVPYLRRQLNARSNTVQFHNLCLHRIRERDNSMDKVDLIPRGTLLNYIDDIFAKPATITDRTLGSWENIIRALPDIPEDIRPQMHNVCFDLLPCSFSGSNTNQPQNHNSFTTDFAFWKDDFIRGPKPKDVATEEPPKPIQTGIDRATRQSPPLKK